MRIRIVKMNVRIGRLGLGGIAGVVYGNGTSRTVSGIGTDAIELREKPRS